MSLTFDFQFFYIKHSSASVQSLEKQHKYICSQLKNLQFRNERYSCDCELANANYEVFEDNGKITASFLNVSSPFCDACKRCFRPYPKEWMGAGYSMSDHCHPFLYSELLEFLKYKYELAIESKCCEYDTLTDETLEELLYENNNYERYLDRCREDFDDSIPQGLLDEIQENEFEREVLKFELAIRRKKTDFIRTPCEQIESDDTPSGDRTQDPCLIRTML